MEYVEMFFRGVIQIIVWCGFTVLAVMCVCLLFTMLLLALDIFIEALKQTTLFGPLFTKAGKTVRKKGVKLYEHLNKPSHKEEL